MKFRYLVVFAALAFMASCSNEENVQVASVDDDAWVYDESLPVPVTFAAPHVAVQSKAAMTNETFKTAKIGLLGLSDGTEDWNASVENSTVLIPNTEITLADGQILLENEYYPFPENLQVESLRSVVCLECVERYSGSEKYGGDSIFCEDLLV